MRKNGERAQHLVWYIIAAQFRQDWAHSVCYGCSVDAQLNSFLSSALDKPKICIFQVFLKNSGFFLRTSKVLILQVESTFSGFASFCYSVLSPIQVFLPAMKP